MSALTFLTGFARLTFSLTARHVCRKRDQERFFSISRCVAVNLYTDRHEWVSIDKVKATIGISHYAQEHLGEIVFVEVPEVGTKLEANDVAGCLESVKAASEVFSPVGGTVTEVNRELSTRPNLVNSSPHQDGWLYKMDVNSPTNIDKLMTEEAYKKYIGTLEKN